MKAISDLYDLHDFQKDCLSDIFLWWYDYEAYLAKYPNSNTTQSHYLLASPTGTGKSLLELDVLNKLFATTWLITPRVEIIHDMLCKLQETPSIERGFELHITTPIRFRNLLLSGKCDATPSLIIKDETHHDEADTWKQLDTLMPEGCRYIGGTATPYRGTPRETANFYATWGQPRWAISYPKAFGSGYISMPLCRTVPLVDDDLIELSSSGQFEIATVCRDVEDKIDDAFEQVGHWFNTDGTPKRMTLFSVPSSNLFSELQLQATCHKYNLEFISQASTYEQRKRAFASCKRERAALVHINVVSEGVDISIRNHLDLTPRMSPVSFLQVFGRTTRPGEAGEYLCTNRNLERHAYLLDGCLPSSVVYESQQAFNLPSERIRTRAFGLQSLGKLQGFHVKLASGLTITCYNVTQMEGTTKHEYFLILHPSYQQPFWFYKESQRVGMDVTTNKYIMDFGKWVTCEEAPEDFKGFKSSSARTLTPKQQAFWERSCTQHGLCNLQKVDAKKFQILPVLKDAKLCLN